MLSSSPATIPILSHTTRFHKNNLQSLDARESQKNFLFFNLRVFIKE